MLDGPWHHALTRVNQVMLTVGLEQMQMMATVFDGVIGHHLEGLWFRRYA